MSAAALCIVVGACFIELPVRSFTLAWQHTVEKVLWEEDYLVVGAWLLHDRARVSAGPAPAWNRRPMPSSSTAHGSYRPADRWRREVRLARSEFGSDYLLCIEGRCRPMADVAPGPIAATTLRSCAAADSR